MPWDTDSTDTSGGPNSYKYVDFLGDFQFSLGELCSDQENKATVAAFRAKFSADEYGYYLLRETLLDEQVRADGAGASDGQTVIARNLGD